MVMELFRKVAHEQGGGVIDVTHDQRSLDVFDTIYEMEDGRVARATTKAQASPHGERLSSADPSTARET